jgi:hypothetical protein
VVAMDWYNGRNGGDLAPFSIKLQKKDVFGENMSFLRIYFLTFNLAFQNEDVL